MRKKEREITSIDEMEKIILEADVCRIALADNNLPYIVTMNFGYSGGTAKKLYFHCAVEGKKLDMIRKNNYACFEIDTGHNLVEGKEACDFTMKYKSILGWGHIHIIGSEEEKKEGLNKLMEHYSDRSEFRYYPEVLKKTFVLRLDIESMTGKRL